LKDLDEYYEMSYPEFLQLRASCKQILTREDELTEKVQLHSIDGLSESEKLTIQVARIIREDFLQQYLFSDYDRFCPFYKAFWMLKNIITFYELGITALESSSSSQSPSSKHQKTITWNDIKQHLKNNSTSERDILYSLSEQKFQRPADGQERLTDFYKKLNRTICEAFDSLV